MATTKTKTVLGSIPPGIVDHIHSYLRISIGRILWLIQEHPQSVYINVKWWGERTHGKKLRIQDHNLLKREKYVEAVYAIRCPQKQFSSYLNDMECLLLGVYSEKSELIGTITVSSLNRLHHFKPINGFFPIIAKDLTKIATIHIKLVIENTLVERIKPSQIPMESFVPQCLKSPVISRNAPIPSTNFKNTEKAQLNKASVTKKFPSPTNLSVKKDNFKNSNHYQYITRDWKLSGKIKDSDNGFNRMRSSFLKTEKPKATSFQSNSSDQQELRTFTPEILHCLINEEDDESAMTIEHSAMKLLFGDNEMAAEIKAIKNMQNVSDSSDDDSFLSYDDPAQNESLLEDLFYTKSYNMDLNEAYSNTKLNAQSYNGSKKENPSLIPKVSFEKKITRDVSDIETKLSSSHRALLYKARFMRIIVESCSLDGYSSFMKQLNPPNPSSFIIEYQYPKLPSNKELIPNQLSMTNVRVIAKKIDKKMVYFRHRSVFPVKFSDASLKQWMKLAVSFRLYVKLDSNKPLSLLGTSIFELQSVLESNSFSVSSVLPIGHSKDLLSEHKLKSPGICNLHVKFELVSDEQGYRSLSSIQDSSVRTQAGSSTAITKKIKKNIQDHLIKEKDFLCRKQNDNIDVRSQSLPTIILREPLFIMLTISHGIGFEPRINVNDKSPFSSAESKNKVCTDRNLYLECRFFDADDVSRSSVSWSSLNPVFNYIQKFPMFLNKTFLERSFNNYLFVEVWDNHISKKDQLIGVCKVPLHQFYLAFKNVNIAAQVMKCEHPVKSFEGYLPVNDITSFQCIGQLHVLLLAGTHDQIYNLENSTSLKNIINQEIEHDDEQTEGIITEILNNKSEEDKNSNANKMTENLEISSSNLSLQESSEKLLSSNAIDYGNKIFYSNSVEHTFIIDIKKIEGLTLDVESLWGETECFVQYLFPTNDAHNSDDSLQLFQTSSVITTPNLEFQDVYRHTLTLDSSKSLSDVFIKIFPTGVTFTMWCKSYLSTVTETPVAKGLLPISRLNSLITLWQQKKASIINMKLPLFKLYNQSEISGFLSISISYSSDRGGINDNNVGKHVERKFNLPPQRLKDTSNSREHLLDEMNFSEKSQNENAVMTKILANNNKTTHRSQQKFTAQLSIEQAMHLTLNVQQNSFDTPPNAFVTLETDNPDESISTNFIENNPNPQWNWTANVVLSLKYLLQANNLIFHVWHKQVKPKCAKFNNDNIHLGFATIDLTTLTLGMEKIDGWYNIMNFQGQCIGQLKILIIPLEDVTQYKTLVLKKSQLSAKKMEDVEGNEETYLTKARYCAFPSHIAQFLEQTVSLHSDDAFESSLQEEANHNLFSSGDILKEDGQNKSFLNNLRKKFQELSELCAHLETQTINFAFEKKYIFGDFENKMFFNILHPHMKKNSVSENQELSQWTRFKNCKSISVENLSIQKMDNHTKEKKRLMKWRSLSAPCYSTQKDVTHKISRICIRNSVSALTQYTSDQLQKSRTSYQSPMSLKKASDIYYQLTLEENTNDLSSNSENDEIIPVVLNDLSYLKNCHHYTESKNIETFVGSGVTVNVSSEDFGKKDHQKTHSALLFNTRSKVETASSESNDSTELFSHSSPSNERTNQEMPNIVDKHDKNCLVSQVDCFNQKNIQCECMLLLPPVERQSVLTACGCEKISIKAENVENRSTDISRGKIFSEWKSSERKVLNKEQNTRKEMLSEGSVFKDHFSWSTQKSRRIAAAIFPNGS